MTFQKFPKFPTFAESITLMEPPKKIRHQGLFEMYLRGDPAHILQDAQARGEAYEPATLQLLGELQQGTRKWDDLSDEEKQEIDKAALEFLSPTRVKETTKQAFKHSTIVESGAPSRAQAVDGPGLDPFWWAK